MLTIKDERAIPRRARQAFEEIGDQSMNKVSFYATMVTALGLLGASQTASAAHHGGAGCAPACQPACPAPCEPECYEPVEKKYCEPVPDKRKVTTHFYDCRSEDFCPLHCNCPRFTPLPPWKKCHHGCKDDCGPKCHEPECPRCEEPVCAKCMKPRCRKVLIKRFKVEDQDYDKCEVRTTCEMQKVKCPKPSCDHGCHGEVYPGHVVPAPMVPVPGPELIPQPRPGGGQ
jgi:hypothetical protein